jgi:hypothetical protein
LDKIANINLFLPKAGRETIPRRVQFVLNSFFDCGGTHNYFSLLITPDYLSDWG